MKPVDGERNDPCPCLVVKRELGETVYKCAIADWQPEEGYGEPCLKSNTITCPRFLSNVVWKLEYYQL